MVFNSPQFAFFFLIVVGLFFLIPQRFRWILMLSASYFFYMCWKIDYVPLLAACTLVNYLAALRMAKATDIKKKKKYFGLGVIASLGPLVFFKYVNFFSRSASEVFKACHIFLDMPIFNILLPVGISFYTFQALGYTFDVYRGRIQAETHLGIFALFVAFWPQLFAGPISRAHWLLPQFRQRHVFEYRRVVGGLRLMLWGLFKKVVVADHLALYVDRIYNHAADYQGFTLMMATGFYAVQIYCDFSGYTDMAIGAARVMGYDLMENFKRPYLSRSVREFWQRWHISLSTWFRDYVYIPLGGRRVAKWRWYYNIMVTFLLSGLWHGANWTYVLWGALHGCYLILEHATGNFQERLADKLFPDKNSLFNTAVQVAITLTLVCPAWVFFRANTVSDAFHIFSKMFWIDPQQSGVDVNGMFSFLLSILLILIVIAVDLKEQNERLHDFMDRLPLPARWTAYTFAVWSIAVSAVFGVKNEFIYFQF